jgi:hypothetical protein
MVIKVVGYDYKVKANYMPTTLSRVARSWVINQSENIIKTWNKLCATFIENF